MTLVLSMLPLATRHPNTCPHYHAHQEAMRLLSAGDDAPRDFLYLVDGNYLTALAPRAPRAFPMHKEKYSPPTSGRHAFRLRANPTVTKFINGKNRRCDPAHGLRDLEAQHAAYTAWLHRQGEKGGFEVGEDLLVRRERWVIKDGKRSMPLVAVDFEGWLTVTDAEKFRQSITVGLGHGKAWGLGLLQC